MSDIDTQIEEILDVLIMGYCPELIGDINKSFQYYTEAHKAIKALLIQSNEVYVPIHGTEGRYEVSNYGNVRSVAGGKRSGTVLKQSIRSQKVGYPCITLRRGKKTQTENVHQLVARAFLSNPENKRTVNHKDGDRTNNHVDNLEWATHGENIQHSYDKLGKISSLQKITDKQAYEIKQRALAGENVAQLAKEYGVSISLVFMLRQGKARPKLQDRIASLKRELK